MAILVKNRPWSRRLQNRRGRAVFGPSYKVVPVGDVINDAYRGLGIQGDGLTVPDSSYGLWRGSTNLVTNGGFETNTTGWTNINGTETIARYTSDSKFGSSCLSVVCTNISPQEGANYLVSSVSTLTTYTVSAWVKAPNGTSLDLMYGDNALGLVHQFFTANGSWQRVSLTVTTGATAPAPLVRVSTKSGVSFNGTFYVDGVQLEQQPYATPYIETNGATAGRNQGYVKLPTRVVGVSQGWIAVRIRLENLITGTFIPIFALRDSVALQNYYDGYIDASNNRILFDSHIATPATTSVAANFSASLTIGTTYTTIFKWDSSNIYASANGEAFASFAQPGTISWIIDQLLVGTDNIFSSSSDSEILWVAAGTGTLSDADAATIHAKGDTDDPTNWPSLSAATFFWPADTDAWVIPTLATGSNFTDAATVKSVTAPSSVDVAADIESATTPGVTTPSAAEIAQFVESATIASASSITYTETTQYVESATTAGVTTPSSTDIAADVDSGTISGLTDPSTSTDIAQYVESATLLTTTIPVTTFEEHVIPDSATVSGTSTINSSDVFFAVDSNTIAGVTTPTYTETYQAVDSATVATVGSVSSTDLADYVDADTGAGVTSVSSSEVYVPAANLDADTITDVTSVSATETADYVDQATANSTGSITALEEHEIPDSNTASGTTTITTQDVAAYVDSNTTAGITAVSASDIASYIDSGTSSNTTTVTSSEQQSALDSNTASNTTSVTSIDLAAFVDSNTASGTTSISELEEHVIPDSDTGSSTTVVTSSDLYAAIDSNTATGATSVSAAEEHIIPDSSTIAGSSTIATTDTAQYADQDSPPTVTVISSSDTAQYVESSTNTSTTTISADEQYQTQGRDESTIPNKTSISSADVAAFVDSASTNSATIASATEGGASDASTITDSTTLSATELAAYSDSSSVPGNTTPSATDYLGATESSTIPSSTTPSAADVVVFVESSSLTSITSIDSTDIHGTGRQDSATATSNSSVQYVEQAQYVESAVVLTTTQPAISYVTTYTDASTSPTITYVESDEFAHSPTIDLATVYGITTVGVRYEFAVRITELVAVATAFRWHKSQAIGLRWLAPVPGLTRFESAALNNRFVTSVRRKWVGWKL